MKLSFGFFFVSAFMILLFLAVGCLAAVIMERMPTQSFAGWPDLDQLMAQGMKDAEDASIAGTSRALDSAPVTIGDTAPAKETSPNDLTADLGTSTVALSHQTRGPFSFASDRRQNIAASNKQSKNRPAEIVIADNEPVDDRDVKPLRQPALESAADNHEHMAKTAADPLSRQTRSNDTRGDDTIGEIAILDNRAIGDATIGDTTIGDATIGDATIDDATIDDAASLESTGNQSLEDEPVSDEPVSDEPVSDEPIGEEILQRLAKTVPGEANVSPGNDLQTAAEEPAASRELLENSAEQSDETQLPPIPQDADQNRAKTIPESSHDDDDDLETNSSPLNLSDNDQSSAADPIEPAQSESAAAPPAVAVETIEKAKQIPRGTATNSDSPPAGQSGVAVHDSPSILGGEDTPSSDSRLQAEKANESIDETFPPAESTTIGENRETVGKQAGDSPDAATPARSTGDTDAPAALEQANRSLTADRADMANEQIIGWPMPTALMKDLDQLAAESYTREWAQTAYETLVQLNQLQLHHADSIGLILDCENLAQQLRDYAFQVASDYPNHVDEASRLARVAYRLKRRTDVWKHVYHLATTRQDLVSREPMPASQLISHTTIHHTSADTPAEWREYLLLERAAQILLDDDASENRKRLTARKVLARVHSIAITQPQREYARQAVGQSLLDSLQQVASARVDLGQFLEDLEQFESSSNAVTDFRLNDHFQTFYWHSDKQLNDLATAVNAHYRNANFRIEVSETFINRLLPDTMDFNQPVSDRILGANVFGQSRISNRLRVLLIPDSSNLQFRLQSLGSVLSRTRAHHSGFVFHNLGNASVNASKGIAIGAHGVSLLPTDVSASSSQRLLDVRSRLDGVPLVGWMARRLAQQQQSSKEPQAKQVVEHKLKSEFQTRVDQEVKQRISEARTWFDQNLFQPLRSLELEPTPLQMQTTNDHFVVRYRVAAPDQLAANTARPQTGKSCLLSAQFHQSAINNLLNQIHINGEKFTVDEFMSHIGNLIGRDDFICAATPGHDVTFEFASRDGLRLNFHDDHVAITLKLKKMRLGKGKIWRNLIVTAHYRPQANGTTIHMLLDESNGVTLSGHKLSFRDQLAVRTVFNSVFKPHFAFNLIPETLVEPKLIEGLKISQLLITNGWISISVADNAADSGKTGQPQAQSPRTSRLFRRWR